MNDIKKVQMHVLKDYGCLNNSNNLDDLNHLKKLYDSLRKQRDAKYKVRKQEALSTFSNKVQEALSRAHINKFKTYLGNSQGKNQQ